MVAIDWTEARKVVEETFFYDKINLYKREDVSLNEWNEVVPGLLPVELNIPCNIEVSSQVSAQSEPGISQEKVLRISMKKDAFVPSMSEQYLVQILASRVAIDTSNAWWHVETVQEGQISIVITCKLGKVV